MGYFSPRRGLRRVLKFCNKNYKNVKIPIKKNQGPPLPPALCDSWEEKGVMFLKLSEGSETLNITFIWLGEMFEGDFAETCAEFFSLVSMWCFGEGLV